MHWFSSVLVFATSVQVSSSLFGSRRRDTPFSEDVAFASGSYGVDVSYPIHHLITEGSDRYEYYQRILAGCYSTYTKAECDNTEKYRMKLALKQPPTQHNYTETGFKLMKLPAHIYEPLITFFNAHKDHTHAENWGTRAYTYINHWESETYMIDFDDPNHVGGAELKQYIWDHVKPIIEEWVGRKVVPTSLYGIRVYMDGAFLAPHVDRLPLISSCIIQVDQDTDEPWPVEIYGHDGKAYNVTMQPGDMVLYESHSIVHGRPFLMRGRYYANVFVHYEPVDHTVNNKHDREPFKHLDKAGLDSLHGKVGGNVAGHEALNHDEEEEEDALEEENSGHADGQSYAHSSARKGDLDTLVECLRLAPELLNQADKNGWLPVHEAARVGNLPCLTYLIDMGADLGVATKHGGTPLWWARKSLEPDDPAIAYLVSVGAPETIREL